MGRSVGVIRLQKELKALVKDPLPNIIAKPLPANILEWHYIIFPPADTVYAGGVYHGKVKFPPEYPHKPPGIYMNTPSGRFSCDKRLCLSMSDYHPETWNPLWSISSILNGLLSFMLDNTPTLGSVNSSDSDKRKFAANSMENNIKDHVFRELFPRLVKNYKDKIPIRTNVTQLSIVNEEASSFKESSSSSANTTSTTPTTTATTNQTNQINQPKNENPPPPVAENQNINNNNNNNNPMLHNKQQWVTFAAVCVVAFVFLRIIM